jgi:hypothetical protein
MPSVGFEIERPAAFQRSHVFLRIALLIVIGWVGHPWVLWLGLPVAAAILVAQKGGQRYLGEDGPTVTPADDARPAAGADKRHAASGLGIDGRMSLPAFRPLVLDVPARRGDELGEQPRVRLMLLMAAQAAQEAGLIGDRLGIEATGQRHGPIIPQRVRYCAEGSDKLPVMETTTSKSLFVTPNRQLPRTYGHLLPDSLDRARTALDLFNLNAAEAAQGGASVIDEVSAASPRA